MHWNRRKFSVQKLGADILFLWPIRLCVSVQVCIGKESGDEWVFRKINAKKWVNKREAKNHLFFNIKCKEKRWLEGGREFHL